MLDNVAVRKFPKFEGLEKLSNALQSALLSNSPEKLQVIKNKPFGNKHFFNISDSAFECFLTSENEFYFVSRGPVPIEH